MGKRLTDENGVPTATGAGMMFNAMDEARANREWHEANRESRPEPREPKAESVTDADIAEVLRLHEQATAGEWTNDDGKRKPGKGVFLKASAHEEEDPDGTGRPSRYGPNREYVCNAFTVEDARLIARYRTLAPRLAREVADARAIVAAWKALAKAEQASGSVTLSPRVAAAREALVALGIDPDAA